MFIMTLLFKIAIFTALIAVNHSITLSSIQKKYDKGLAAYKGERWTECIAQFEEALHLYKLYKSVIVNCRLRCNSQKYSSNINEEIGDLKVYEMFFNRKQCLLKCQQDGFKDLNMISDIDDALFFNMQTRQPYQYLHMCYFQMYALPIAASAAYTYLVANPEDEAMNHNLKYYIEQPEVDVKEVVDLLSDDYIVLYRTGLKAYKENNWAETVANMEEAITDYFSSENSCRVECERQPEQEWSPEIHITLSNNIASLLHCQQQCQDKLKLLNYKSGVDFLADVLNYIQISYYHLDRYEEAAKSVATYLVLLPTDEDMLENKKIYGTITDAKAFSERSDIVYYFKRDKYEKELIQLFHKGHSDNVNSNTIE